MHFQEFVEDQVFSHGSRRNGSVVHRQALRYRGWRSWGGWTRHDGSLTRGQRLSGQGAPRCRACPNSLPIRGRATRSELRPTDAIERMDGVAQVPAEQHVIVRGGHPATDQGEGQPQRIAEASSGCVT